MTNRTLLQHTNYWRMIRHLPPPVTRHYSCCELLQCSNSVSTFSSRPTSSDIALACFLLLSVNLLFSFSKYLIRSVSLEIREAVSSSALLLLLLLFMESITPSWLSWTSLCSAVPLYQSYNNTNNINIKQWSQSRWSHSVMANLIAAGEGIEPQWEIR